MRAVLTVAGTAMLFWGSVAPAMGWPVKGDPKSFGFLLLIGAAFWAYHGLRMGHKRGREAALVAARMPASQRERLQEIKRLAGRVMVTLSDQDHKQAGELASKLRDKGLDCVEQSAVWITIKLFLLAARWVSLAHEQYPEFSKEWEDHLGGSYETLLKRCNASLSEGSASLDR